MMKVEDKMKLTSMLAWSAVAVLLLAGCQDENQNGFFKGQAAGDEVNKFGDVEASNGARNDAMLYSYHFTGTHLNSLGRAKVLAMLDNCDNCDPIVVHLVNCGEDDVLAQRKAAVEMYLKTSEGPNLVTFHPAADDMVRMAKTESGTTDQGGSSGSDSGSGAAGGGGATQPPGNK
jgi:uncharacterized membrane protein YgcG